MPCSPNRTSCSAPPPDWRRPFTQGGLNSTGPTDRPSVRPSSALQCAEAVRRCTTLCGPRSSLSAPAQCSLRISGLPLFLYCTCLCVSLQVCCCVCLCLCVCLAAVAPCHSCRFHLCCLRSRSLTLFLSLRLRALSRSLACDRV